MSFMILLVVILFVDFKISIDHNRMNKNKILSSGINNFIKQEKSSFENIEKEIETEIYDKNDKKDEKKESTSQEIKIYEKDGIDEEVEDNESLNHSYVDDVSLVIPETLYKWNFYRDDNKKMAYLTFDDGPSEKSTEKILDILLKNNIKATFFTLGTSINNNKRSDVILKRMLAEGHSIGNHGYSHDYKILYPNRRVDVQAFMNDIDKNDRILKGMLGNDFSTKLVRMPGGHSSWNGTEELDKVLEEKGLYQMDWNALNGDAEGIEYSREELLNNLKDTVGDKDVIIVLMHDTDAKKGTVEYLQDAIDYLKEDGFEFRTLK